MTAEGVAKEEAEKRRKDAATAHNQGAKQAHEDITEFGLPYAIEVAAKMRRDSDTPYADGYAGSVDRAKQRRA